MYSATNSSEYGCVIKSAERIINSSSINIMGNGSIAKRYIATAPIAALTVSSKSEIILEYILFSR